ncbi:hypothetical protein AWV80_22290 [Cupriavidus sp. UYMU48A]|nr:hypothetical protein AWV80_22290 [Cupriavidus sp. UYMU48A]
MALRQNYDEPVIPIVFEFQSLNGIRTDQDAKVRESGQEKSLRFIASTLFQIKLHGRMYGNEARKILRQELDDGGRISEQADLAPRTAPEVAERIIQSLKLCQHPTSVVQQFHAGRRKRNSTAVPID